MDFRLTKFRLTLAMLLAGWLAAVAYHGYEGGVLHRGYPYNTFLFRPQVRFSDFNDTALFLTSGAPYRLAGGRNIHLPADYMMVTLFRALPGSPSAAVYVVLEMVALFGLLLAALQPLFPRLPGRALAALPFLLSYPCLYGFDRGNSEAVLAFFIGLSLLLYWKKRFGLSFAALLLPICFKLYPVVLLLLFVRRRLIGWVALFPVAFVLVTWLCLYQFIDPPLESLRWLGRQLSDYNMHFNLGQDGIAASASAWNLVRFGAWAARALCGQPGWPVPAGVLLPLLKLYDAAMALFGAALAWHVLFVERSFARRAILLLVYLTVSVPGGGAYKLMHVVTALVVLILIPRRRAFDLAATFCLALAILPKQEIIFPFFGPSDSLVADCSIAVFINPVAQLMAMGLLIAGTYRAGPRPSLKQQAAKLASLLHLPRFWPVNAAP